MSMVVLLLIMLPLLLLLTRLRMDITFRLEAIPFLRVTARLLFVKKAFRFRLLSTPSGHEIQSVSESGVPHRIDPEKLQRPAGKRMLSAFFSAKHARRFLFQHIQDFDVSGDVIVQAGNAAGTAMITGGMQVISRLLSMVTEQVKLRCSPGFASERTTIHVRCIFSLRLGTLAITSAMVLLHLFRQQIQARGR